MKKTHQQYQTDDGVISAIDDFFSPAESFFNKGFQKQVCAQQGRLYKKINHIWSNSTIASWSVYDLFRPPLYTGLIVWERLDIQLKVGYRG